MRCQLFCPIFNGANDKCWYNRRFFCNRADFHAALFVELRAVNGGVPITYSDGQQVAATSACRIFS